MVLYFPNNEIQIYRFRRKGATDKLAYSATLTVYDADIQPSAPGRTELESGQTDAVFTAFVDVTADVKEGDELRVIGTTKIYTVQGVSRWEGAGILDHIELALTAKDDNG